MLFPVGILTIMGVGFGMENPEVFREILSDRALTLLTRTITHACLVAISATVMGLICGLAVWNIKGIPATWSLYTILVLILIPSYIHAQSWIFLVDRINETFTGYDFNGFYASWFVLVMAYLPYVIGLTLIGLYSMDKELIENGKLYGGPLRVAASTIIPQCYSLLVTAFNIVFILNLVDYTIPSLFGIRVYPMQIYARFSAEPNPGLAFIDSLPLLIIGGSILYLTYKKALSFSIDMHGWGDKRAGNDLEFSNSFMFNGLMIIGIVVLLFQIFVPVINLVIEADSMTALIQSRTELMHTLTASFLAAITGTILALGLSEAMVKSHAMRRIVSPVLMFTYIMPAPLIGIGLNIFGRIIGDAISNSIVIIALAGIIRFLPIATALMYVQYIALDSSVLDAGRLFMSNYLEYQFKVKMPLLAGGLMGSAGILFALTAGELGATLMVAPPGKGTLTIKIFNYLHYGASGTVASLCLALFVIIMIPGIGFAVRKLMGQSKTE